ncbi:protein SLX4IP [Colossoma macropomum]|uniref:protein SLX4IP n=1 Tax=Colossoma macropomum TaxID=42526 RepID=UPI001864CED6|nr:protein SLX4IP [Colossoma macropomum]XP_036438770.1 protein SLX4IP [Colossoma macropomum]
MQSRMQKLVLKCGKFVVLVDVHILPQGSQNGSTWFLQEHKEEVGALTKDAVEQRVRLFRESRQGQSKQTKELSPDNPMCIKGQTLRLAAYFMKRHVNLRCVIRQHYQELRVFPERFIVCVSLPENGMAPFGNLNMMEQSRQSRSGYFSGPRETVDPLNSSTVTKRAALQKIARQADAHPRPEPEHKFQDQNQLPSDAEQFVLQEKGTDEDEVMDVSMQRASEGDKTGCNDSHTEKVKQDLEAEDCAEQRDMYHDSESNPQDHQTTGKRRRRIPSSPREDFNHQEAKRACVRELFIGAETRSGSTMALMQSSTLGPSPSHPGAAAQASSEGMLEEELLTHGKQAPCLPLSNNTAKHTNQSRLAASLRGLSVRAVSSSSSISSRSAAKEEKPSVPRMSRLRRLKKS